MQSDSESQEVDGSISGGDYSGVDTAELEARLRLQPGLLIPGVLSSELQRQEIRLECQAEDLTKDRRIVELEAQVEGLRQRKSDLARKVDFEQDVREQINCEIRRLQEKAQADLEALRSNMGNLHRKEVSLLQERLQQAEEKAAKLQSRLDQEEQAHQALQLMHNRLRHELHNEITEKVEKDQRLLLQDSDAHARRAQLLEEQLVLRDERLAELQAKVESLKEKKKDLARKVELEQVNNSQEVRDQINMEIRRFQEKAQADLEAVRSNMAALHQKEVTLLQERLHGTEERLSSTQHRLESEEQSRQAQQLSFSRVRAELQNEITELTGSLKLKSFEVERAAFAMEEISSNRQRLTVENEQLKKQMEVMRQELYTLEMQYKEGRAAERAELMSLREQTKSYMNLEKDLDATIKSCAEAEAPADAQEAFLIGSALGSAPASAQRRIQQSLLLAQELQKKNREARETAGKLDEAQKDLASLRDELEAVRLQGRATKLSEPQVYLHTALREQKAESSRLKRELHNCRQELEGAHRQAESAHMAKLRVEEDLRKLLLQRQHLDELRSLVQAEQPCKQRLDMKPERVLLRT